SASRSRHSSRAISQGCVGADQCRGDQRVVEKRLSNEFDETTGCEPGTASLDATLAGLAAGAAGFGCGGRAFADLLSTGLVSGGFGAAATAAPLPPLVSALFGLVEVVA